MTSLKARRTRLGSLIAVALGAAAIFVLPGLASARDDSSSGTSGATIKSFDQATRTLAIALPNGETVTGTVTARTRIRCEDQSGHHGRHGRDGIRGREAEPGDDHGGHGVEPGDDNGGGNSGPGSSDSGQSGPSGHDDNGSGANCTTADLVAGAAVDEIEVDFGQTSVRFDEIELDD
jgi:hypothetical protein